MRNIIATLITISVTFPATAQQLSARDSLVTERIADIYSLKSRIAQKYWQGFDDSTKKVPFIYYTDSVCYIANPTQKFLSIFPGTALMTKHDDIHIYKTASRIDQVVFHMEASISMGAGDSIYYDFREPFVRSSEYETAVKIVPGNLKLPEWQAMIIHEFFHAYQFRHASTADVAHKSNATVSALNDSLQTLFTRHAWYRESINRENGLLLDAIKDGPHRVHKETVMEFIRVRAERRQRIAGVLGFSITRLEQMFEKLEGTARYMEAAVLREEGSISDTAWIYDTKVSDTYFYATGYNLSRLLDLVDPQFKAEIFNKGELMLEEVLTRRSKR